MKTYSLILSALFLFGIACSAVNKTVEQPPTSPSIAFGGTSRICNDGMSTFTYSRDAYDVCTTDVGNITVFDVGCNGSALEVCDNDVSYIVRGGPTNLNSRNCGVSSSESEKAVKAHMTCLNELAK